MVKEKATITGVITAAHVLGSGLTCVHVGGVADESQPRELFEGYSRVIRFIRVVRAISGEYL